MKETHSTMAPNHYELTHLHGDFYPPALRSGKTRWPKPPSLARQHSDLPRDFMTILFYDRGSWWGTQHQRAKTDRENSARVRRRHHASFHRPEFFSLASQFGWATCEPLRRSLNSEWWTGDNQETNPIAIKPETVNEKAGQSSWVPWPPCSPPRKPLPITV